jgi:hypothetical protein
VKAPYIPWISVAAELRSLHGFAYGSEGPLHKLENSPLRPTAVETAEWLQKKCDVGRWYWWDKTTLAMHAEEPLRSIERMIGDGGLYEQDPQGIALIARISAIRATISKALNR